MLIKYKDFKKMSMDEMKNAIGGSVPPVYFDVFDYCNFGASCTYGDNPGGAPGIVDLKNGSCACITDDGAWWIAPTNMC